MYYNIRVGILAQWKKLILAAIVIVVLCLSVHIGLMDSIQVLGLADAAPGPLDYYLSLMAGTPPAARNSDIAYQMPTISLLFWMVMSFCVGNFPAHELRTQSENVLLFHRSRIRWYCGKVMWNALFVALYYWLLAVVLVLFSAVVQGRLAPLLWMLHFDLFLEEPVLGGDFWIAVLGVPVATTIAMTQMQFALSLICGPMVSYMVLVTYFVCSAYIQTPLLIGNGLLLIRNRLFASGRCSTTQLLLGATVHWIIFCWLGHLAFRRHPILKTKEG